MLNWDGGYQAANADWKAFLPAKKSGRHRAGAVGGKLNFLALLRTARRSVPATLQFSGHKPSRPACSTACGLSCGPNTRPIGPRTLIWILPLERLQLLLLQGTQLQGFQISAAPTCDKSVVTSQ